MLRSCVIDFEGSWEKYFLLVEFAYNNSYQASIKMVPYEALYGRKCRTLLCWTELGEDKIVGPNLVRQTEEKVKLIRDNLKVAADRQKSYADLKRKDIEYKVADKVFLKVLLWKKVLRSDPSHVISVEKIDVQPDVTYEEEPLRILAREVKELRNKRIPLVKVLWKHHNTEEITLAFMLARRLYA
ncbi:uncharacterized protein LOC110663341 [Hevea brasiliensis]|uniref:uncharacterized protein LOC110663341 n=1 Tax=Hevea brasiliensis TaxID=3981 RepID=UPI0025DE4524|nr:uncharacterized protein LOC110663341 [Hevea brasiliensis]